MAYTRLSQWFGLALFLPIFLRTEGFLVNITYLESAVCKGAVCLDGSPPAYHFHKGSGAGINSWLLYLEGGAWCNSVKNCMAKTITDKGSSKNMSKQFDFTGILSNEKEINPYFYNWNIVRIRYCDGASFTGDVEAVDPATNLHFRGARIWQAVMEDLLAKGMKDAENAILTGCSAGALATILHCDNFQSLMPNTTKVKCVSDGGFFINAKDITGAPTIETYFSKVVQTHGSAKNLPKSCTSKMRPELCFFPQNVIEDVQTPIFIINGAYDLWQMVNILVPSKVEPKQDLDTCALNISNCLDAQMKTRQDFRSEFLDALSGFEKNSKSNGMFIDSCYVHCQADKEDMWYRNDSTLVGNKKMADAVGEWFNDDEDRPLEKPDCPYPSNPTCHNTILLPQYLLPPVTLY